jgi:NuA3 HAT complex component NTO1
MIFCDGCDVCVHQVCSDCISPEQCGPPSDIDTIHQSCYGVLKIPEGDWFCDRCAVKAKDEPCVLCPVYEGAMKRTEQGDWCHVSCVWWIPEVHFKDTILMRPVMGVPGVSKKRFQLKCMFCDTKNGARPLVLL